MRMLRGLLTTAVALAGLLPSVAEAQQGRRFENSWFWGLKGGDMFYSSPDPDYDDQGELISFQPANRQAGFVGLEWLITRTRGGLYISYDHAILDQETVFLNPADSAIIRLGMKNTRRVNIAGMFFPPVTRWAQPYVGLGFGYIQVGATELRNPEVIDQPTGEAFMAFVTENKSQFQPLAILGAQARFRPFSVFLQGSATPFRDDFILRGGRGAAITIEGGIRYNIGNSIDRL